MFHLSLKKIGIIFCLLLSVLFPMMHSKAAPLLYLGTSPSIPVYIGTTSKGDDVYMTQDSIDIMMYNVEYNYHDWAGYIVIVPSTEELREKLLNQILEKKDKPYMSWVNTSSGSRVFWGIGAYAYVHGDTIGYSLSEDYFNTQGEILGMQYGENNYSTYSSENSEVHHLIIDYLNNLYYSIYGERTGAVME